MKLSQSYLLSLLSLLSLLFLVAGCQYDAPLAREHTILVDPAVLGAWEYIPGEREDPASVSGTSLLVMKFSDTEYLLYYVEDGNGLYARGYAINIGNISAIQLELIGNDDGPIKNEDWDLYNVASYRLQNGELEIRMLNPELVDDDLADSDSIKQAFLKHKNDPELFTNPGRFKRITE